MDFIEDAVSKAKEVFDVACQKTGDVVNTSKQKFEIANLENKRKKDFEVLGRLYFEKIKDSVSPDDSIGDLVLSIKQKTEKIDKLKADLSSSKDKRICPKCGAVIDSESIFCNICGEKIVFDSNADFSEENTDSSENI